MSLDRRFTLPAIRGIQATREYFVVMCRIRLIDTLDWIDPSLVAQPRLRAQRTLTKSRIPEICDYIVRNPKEYVLPAITLTVDSEVDFRPASSDPKLYSVGVLEIPSSAKFLVNDGQHRLAGIRAALRIYPELAHETISCVLFVDTGLKRAQRVFADLNRHALRPSRSLCILYDPNDPLAELTRKVVDNLPLFARLTDLERSSIPRGSSKLFTLSGVYRATAELVGPDVTSARGSTESVLEFWGETCRNTLEWQAVDEQKIPALLARERYVHCCTLGLIGIGRAGHTLLALYPDDWHQRLRAIGDLNWSRDNVMLWEGRATTGGRISTSRGNEILVGNLVKMALDLPLASDEQTAEDSFRQARGLQIVREVQIPRYAN